MHKAWILAGLSTGLLLCLTTAFAGAWPNPHPQARLGQVLKSSATEPLWLVSDPGTGAATIAYDRSTGQPRFILPSGLRSADGAHYFAAFDNRGKTAVHSFDLTNGAIRASLALDGDWGLRAVSANGKWLALQGNLDEKTRAIWQKTRAWKTEIALVDAEQGKVARSIALDGNFDVDAVDTNGSALFLIQHIPAENPDHYQVRWYDLAAGQLQEGAIVDKRASDEVMAGYPQGTVASPDGQWSLTLYLNTREHRAFIHALNLHDRYAWCIDLPSNSGDLSALEDYALALAPDGHTLYASNPTLGILGVADLFDVGDVHVIPFEAPAGGPGSPAVAAPTNHIVASPDGKAVWFTDEQNVWSYDVRAGQLKKIKRSAMPIIGLEVSQDGKTIYFANADHTITALSLPAVAGAEGVSAVAQTESAPSACPVTKPSSQVFVPPAPFPAQSPYAGEFWYGTRQLWTMLDASGEWTALPQSAAGFTQKILYWREGYDWLREPTPLLTVTGKRLDAPAPPLVASQASNGFQDQVKSFMVVGVNVPTEGCWEITGRTGDQELRFVVWVTPN